MTDQSLNAVDTTEAIAQWFCTVDQDTFDVDDFAEGAEESLWRRIAQHALNVDRAALADAGYVIVKVPVVPYAGVHPQSSFYTTAARNVREDFPVGGSNVTAAVAELLASVGAALAAREEVE